MTVATRTGATVRPIESFGRDAEMQWLQAWWTAARAAPLAVVAGESGVGKSHLLAHFADSVARGTHVLHGVCTEHQFLAYEPWMNALRSVLLGAEGDLRTQVLDQAATELAGVPWLRDLVPTVQPTVRGLPDDSAVRHVVVDLIRRLSELGPVLIVVDDIHWVDSGSLGVLAPLIDAELPQCRVLVAERRPATRPGPWHAGDLPLASSTDELLLDRLSPGAVASLVRATLDRPVPEIISDAVYRASGGNAFVTVTLASVVGRSLLSDADVAERLPRTASAIWAARVDAVSSETLRVLMVAAVEGSECELELLRVAASDIGHVGRAIEQANAAGLIEIVDGRLRFVHALLREYLYGDLTQTRRRRIHRRLGQHLAGQVGTAPSASSAKLAYHWNQSGPSGRVESLTHLVGAARWAATQGASDAAYSLADQALDLLATLDGEKVVGPALLAARRSELGDVLLRLGHPAGVEVMVEAASYFSKVDDVLTLAWIADALLRAGQFTGPASPGTELAESLVGRIDGVDQRLQSRILARLSRSLEGRSGAGAFQAQLSATALQLARESGDTETLANALFCHSTDRPWTDERLEQINELVAIGRAEDNVEFLLYGTVYLHTILLDRGDIEAAEELFDDILDVHGRITPGYLGVLRNADLAVEADAAVAARRVHRAQLAGRFDEQEALVAELTGYLDFAGVEHDRLLYLVAIQHGFLAWNLGRLDEFIPFAVGFAEERPEAVHRKICAGFVLAEAGRLGDAESYYRPIIERGLRDLTIDQMTSSMLNLLAWTTYALGDVEGAALVEEALAPFEGRNSCFIGGSFGPTLLGLGLCSAVQGHLALALERLSMAIGQCQRWGADPYLARAHLFRARVLADTEDLDAAADDAESAAALADRLGMPQLHESAAEMASAMRRRT